MSDTKSRLLTIDQVCELTQFSKNTVKQAIKDGDLRHGKFGRLIRVREEDLSAWINRKIAVTMRLQAGLDAEVSKMQAIEKNLVGRS